MKREHFDISLFFIVLLLLGIGIVTVYSASSIIAEQKFNDSAYFLKQQLLRIVIAIILIIILSNIKYETYRGITIPFLGFSILMLLYILVLGYDEKIKGAARWINIGNYSFQPSEFTKLALIFYTADALVRKKDKLESFKEGFLPHIFVLTLCLVMIVLQPDFSTAFSIGMIIFIMYFVGNVKWRHLLSVGAVGAAAAYFLIFQIGYRKARFTAFLEGALDSNIGYQSKQALISLGNGGITGIGIGQSKQRMFFLPEPFGDFIFAIIGEEMGFIGSVLVLTLFALLMWHGLKIARNAQDDYSRLLAVGITAMFSLYAFLNIGVVVSLLPTTGLPIPFISYGGSNLIVSAIGIAVLMNISARIERAKKEQLIPLMERHG